MWPFSRNTEVRISDRFGEPYFDCLVAFLEGHFNAQFRGKNPVEFDLSCFDYSIGDKTLTIISEGMAGTSLLGERKLVHAVIKKAKEVEPQLVDRVR